ncbi:NhaP-type Na+/H+ and K+/H+ antiporter [Lysinibacillus composti]|uniref:Glucosamine 6-phosphate synthetase n=1 Tax=Lysinibacillus composti TaxID=720633 RepID=A0A3N9UVF0_9BACI|nr:glucosamine 6-phosphate synthetase [Lysinibacillus composti]MBM7607621.1 NhaP-type Na+/H+ and K+/H+ antiporter [Lysinibacillus composti]RQW75876.1 glucosamine 6-phosphate synthetase [Lysinibacillus composti]
MQNVSKRTILWIVPLIIIGIFWYFYGPQEEITDNEYISYIKETKMNNSDSVTLDEAFTNYCEEGKWVYFQTQKNQHVVEYKGTCPVNGEKNEINLQFVVEKDQSNYDTGVLLLNGVQQEADQRDEFLQTVAKN